MADVTIISDGAALVGAGAWFADKVLGPSAEGIGEQLKAYFSRRIDSIFTAAGSIAQERSVEVLPIPPGLLSRMIMDASFSEEDEDITRWWANLLIDASASASNRHAVFSDMMATIGPGEAKCLKDFMESFSFMRSDPAMIISELAAATESMRFEAIQHWLGELPVPQEKLHQVRANLLTGEVPWPIRPISWSFPLLIAQGTTIRANQVNPWYAENVTNVAILERARVLEFGQSAIETGGHQKAAWVKTVAATSLGIEFYAACTGSAFLSKRRDGSD